MEIDGALILTTIDEMYRAISIENFMKRKLIPIVKPMKQKSETIF